VPLAQLIAEVGMNPDTNNMKLVWDSVDEAVIKNDEGLDDSILHSLSFDLEKACESNPNLLYPLAYVLYCHKNRRTNAEIQVRCANAFEAAINAGCETDLAGAFLAFHYFDIGNYSKVLAASEMVDFNQLHENIEIRLREVVLCSQIGIAGFLSCLKEIKLYIEFISQLSSPDVPPLHLIRVLELESCDTLRQPDSLRLLRDLDRAYPILGDHYFTRLANSAR
jgi:hypothetical protein